MISLKNLQKSQKNNIKLHPKNSYCFERTPSDQFIMKQKILQFNKNDQYKKLQSEYIYDNFGLFTDARITEEQLLKQQKQLQNLGLDLNVKNSKSSINATRYLMYSKKPLIMKKRNTPSNSKINEPLFIDISVAKNSQNKKQSLITIHPSVIRQTQKKYFPTSSTSPTSNSQSLALTKQQASLMFERKMMGVTFRKERYKHEKLNSKAIIIGSFEAQSVSKQTISHDQTATYQKKTAAYQKEINVGLNKSMGSLKSRQNNPTQNSKSSCKNYITRLLKIQNQFQLKSIAQIRPKTVNSQYEKNAQKTANINRRYDISFKTYKQKPLKLGMDAASKDINFQIFKTRFSVEQKQLTDLIIQSPQRKANQLNQKCYQQMYESKYISQKKACILFQPRVFIFCSKDHAFIPEYLRRHNWTISTNSNITNYHLKWLTQPSVQQHSTMHKYQLYNHFHKSYELTSKGCLAKNLRDNKHLFKTSYFPEAYDIGNQLELQEFMQKYKYNKVMSLLRKIKNHCMSNKLFVQAVRQNVTLIKDFTDNNDYSCLSNPDELILQTTSITSMSFENFRNVDQSLMLNMFLVLQTLKFLRFQRLKYDIDYVQVNRSKTFLDWNAQNFLKIYPLLEIYEQAQNVSQPSISKGLLRQNFATPSDFCLKLIAHEYAFFSYIHKWPSQGGWPERNQQSTQYKQPTQRELQQNFNIWIIKPSSASKGAGISVCSSLEGIIKCSKSVKSRIVQHYIPNPLLFKKSPFHYLNNHKFDIRQWVLLKSICPLQVYVFDRFYLRLAGNKYSRDESSLVNQKIHLTNYSINKQGFKDKSTSLISSQQFEQLLWKEYNLDFNSSILPQIHKLIISSIKSCQSNLQSPSNASCFELLGYDILIDSNFKPWLLQVNMSPACEERADWLTDYLKDMNQGLLDIVLGPQFLQGSPKHRIQRKNTWNKICFEDYFTERITPDTNLEVVGQAISTKAQRPNINSMPKQILLSNSSMIKQKQIQEYQYQDQDQQLVQQLSIQDVIININLNQKLDEKLNKNLSENHSQKILQNIHLGPKIENQQIQQCLFKEEQQIKICE